MARIFISYRRDDAGYVASMVRERLETEFGAGAVFMDIDNIPLGVDFRQHLSDAVATCDVLVALIGETWAGPLAGGTQRRIDDPQDFVRIEIEAALKRGIPVVPVLIDKAQPPAVQNLPDSLRELAFRNAAELRAGRDLTAHLDTLSHGLRAHLGRDTPLTAPHGAAAGRAAAPTARARHEETASTPVTAPANRGAATAAPAHSPATSRLPLAALAAGAALLLLAAAGWWAFARPAGSAPQAPVPRVGTAAPTPAPAAVPAALPSAPPTAAPGVVTTATAADIRLLDGYKIAIFYLAGDTAAGQTARAIRETLAAKGVQQGVELRLATAQKMRALVPPDGLEVRFDEGREDAQARLLAGILATRDPSLRPKLRPVPADERTPNFISVFVPAGG